MILNLSPRQKEWYRKRKEIYMDAVSAKHILVKHEYEIEDLEKKLKDGTPFEDLAQKFSTCPSGKRGGDLGSFRKGRMVKPFEEAAFGLQVGQVSSAVRTQFGYHLILRYG
jgi:peptidyl-prolyl cis-trans isomerase C